MGCQSYATEIMPSNDSMQSSGSQYQLLGGSTHVAGLSCLEIGCLSADLSVTGCVKSCSVYLSIRVELKAKSIRRGDGHSTQVLFRPFCVMFTAIIPLAEASLASEWVGSTKSFGWPKESGIQTPAQVM